MGIAGTLGLRSPCFIPTSGKVFLLLLGRSCVGQKKLGLAKPYTWRASDFVYVGLLDGFCSSESSTLNEHQGEECSHHQQEFSRFRYEN